MLLILHCQDGWFLLAPSVIVWLGMGSYMGLLLIALNYPPVLGDAPEQVEVRITDYQDACVRHVEAGRLMAGALEGLHGGV